MDDSFTIMANLINTLKFLRLTKSSSNKIQAAILHTTIALILFASIIPQMLLVFSDNYTIFEKTEALAIMIPMYRVFFKMVIRVSTMDTFWDLYDDIKPMYTAGMYVPSQKEKLQKSDESANFTFKCFTGTYIFLLAVFNVLPLVVAAIFVLFGYPSGLTMPFQGEYYCDSSENPAFAIIYTVQTLSASMSVYPAVWDSAFLSFNIHVLVQVEILSENLNQLNGNKTAHEQINHHKQGENKVRTELGDIPRVDLSSMAVSATTSTNHIRNNTNTLNDDEGIKSLEQCIVRHQMVIKLVKNLQDVFGLQLALEFLFAAVISCLCMFQVTHVPGAMVKFKYTLLVISFYASLYVMIRYGQKLLNESEVLEARVYALPWADRGVRYGRLVALVLQRTQIPLGITAMYFYRVSAATFLALLKASFSYFALLQTAAEN